MSRRIRTLLVAIVVGFGLAAAPAIPASAARPVVIAAPGAPTITHLTAIGAVVSWTPSSSPGVALYILETLVNGQWTGVGISGLPPAVPTAMSVTLTPSTTYTYAVVAEDQNGHQSPLSPSTTFSTPPRDTALTCAAHFNPILFTGGFLAQLSIRNTGTFIVTTGWTLNFAFPGDQQITPNTAYGGIVTQSGQNVTAVNNSFNPFIDAFGQIGVQFLGTYTGTFVAPTGFTVNGVRCTLF